MLVLFKVPFALWFFKTNSAFLCRFSGGARVPLNSEGRGSDSGQAHTRCERNANRRAHVPRSWRTFKNTGAAGGRRLSDVRNPADRNTLHAGLGEAVLQRQQSGGAAVRPFYITIRKDRPIADVIKLGCRRRCTQNFCREPPPLARSILLLANHTHKPFCGK